MTKLIVLLAATVLSVSAFAADQAHKDHKSKAAAATFESLDKNGDSQLSKSEASADKAVADNFAAIDTNGDGYVSKSEFAAQKKS